MVNYEVKGRAGIITINRPDKKNSVNGDVAQGIEDGIDQIENDPEVYTGIITGAGGVFCAGADLKALGEGRGAEINTERGGFAGITQRKRTKPMIAAVDGFALAGGTEIVLSCDMIVASVESSFGIPEVKRCLIPGAGGLFRLARVLPRNIAVELTATGDPITAQRAYDLGMVNELTEVGGALDAALALAERIAYNAPLAVQASLQLMEEFAEVDDDAAFAKSQEVLVGLTASEDFGEGINAFLEKRDPVWKGR